MSLILTINQMGKMKILVMYQIMMLKIIKSSLKSNRPHNNLNLIFTTIILTIKLKFKIKTMKRMKILQINHMYSLN